MPIAETAQRKSSLKSTESRTCYHCGERCLGSGFQRDGKSFCCEGCLLVFDLIKDNGLCNYYELQSHPGLNKIRPVRKEKFSFLDEPDIAASLYQFHDGKQAIVRWYIPGVHCSSCM